MRSSAPVPYGWDAHVRVTLPGARREKESFNWASVHGGLAAAHAEGIEAHELERLAGQQEGAAGPGDEARRRAGMVGVGVGGFTTTGVGGPGRTLETVAVILSISRNRSHLLFPYSLRNAMS